MKISDYYTYAPKSKIKAGDANPNGKYQFYASSPDKSRRCDEYLYDCKAIIMGTGGSATLHYYDGKFSTSTDCLTLIPNEKIRAKYLYYFFLANMDVLEAGFKGAGLKHTNKGYIDNIEITKIPSLSSQDKIVNLFDELASIIEKERRQIEKLDDLIKARFVEMLGASVDTVPLRDICETASGGTPSTKHPDYYKGTIPWISTTALGPNHISGDSAKAYITEEAIINSATKLIPKGNLLFGIRVGVGKTSINDVDICTNQDIVAITNIDEARFSKLFIKHVLDSNQTYYDSLKKGATILGITSDDLKNTPIPLVSFSRQKLFESFVEQVDKSKFTLSNKLAVCNFYVRLVYDRIMHGRIDL